MNKLRDIASVKPRTELMSAVSALKPRNIEFFFVLNVSKPFNILSETFTESILSRIGNSVGMYSLLSSFPLEYLSDGERKGALPANIQLKLFLGSIAEKREKTFINKNIDKIAANVSQQLHLKYSVKNYNNYKGNVLRNILGGNSSLTVNMFNYGTSYGSRGGNYGGENIFDYVSKEKESSNRLLKSVLHYLSVFNSHMKGSDRSIRNVNVNGNITNYSNRVPGVFELIDQTYIEQKNRGAYISGDTVSRISNTMISPVIRHFDLLFNSFNNQNSDERSNTFAAGAVSAANYSASNISRNVISRVSRQFDNLFNTFSGDIYNKIMSQYITNVRNINSVGDSYENRNYSVYGSYNGADYKLITPTAANAEADGTDVSTAAIAGRLRRHFAMLFGGLGRKISDIESSNSGSVSNGYSYVSVTDTSRSNGAGGDGIRNDDVRGGNTRGDVYYSDNDDKGGSGTFIDNITVTSRNIAERLTRHIEVLLSNYGVGINRKGNFTVLNVSGFNRAQGDMTSAVGNADRDMPSVNYNAENEYRNFSLIAPIRKMESDIQIITGQIMSSVMLKYKSVLDFIDNKAGATQKSTSDISRQTEMSSRLKHIGNENKFDSTKNDNTEKVNNFSNSIKSHSDTDNNFYDKSNAIIRDLAYLSTSDTAIAPTEKEAETIDFGKDMPIWASRFLNDSMKNKTDSGGVVPEFNTVTGIETIHNGRNVQNTVWNAPQYNNSYKQNEIVLKKNDETTNNYRQSISKAEINNVANKVYEIIEKRVGVERRRLGF